MLLETTERSDETGHLYGSVNASRVAELLNEKGFEIDDDNIRMERAIKDSGTHEIELHLFGETSVNVTIEVTGEGENREAAIAEIIAEIDAEDEDLEADETEESDEAAEQPEEAPAEDPPSEEAEGLSDDE